MAIRPESEIRHETLGPIRYDDGQPPDGGAPVERAKWVARPHGWDGDLEFYLCADEERPDPVSLQRAASLLADLARITEAARARSGQDLEVAWIDCTEAVATVALTDARDPYLLWTATLDAGNGLGEMTRACW